MYFLCISEQTATLSYAILTDWFLEARRIVLTARYEFSLQQITFRPSKVKHRRVTSLQNP